MQSMGTTEPMAPRRPKGRSRRSDIPRAPPNPSQAVSAYTSIYLAHQKMVGRMVIAWSTLEGAMQSLIWEFLNLGMSDGRIITSRLDASTMTPMLRALGLRYLMPEHLEEFLDLLATIDEYRLDRNFVVHGQWIILEPHSVPAAMSLRPKAEAGGVVSETFPVERLSEIVHHIEDSRHQLIAIEDKIKANREKWLRQHPKD